MDETIFITYNPKSSVEENTALRLQTISYLYGLSIDLPYRLGRKHLPTETQVRIKRATFVVAFCLSKLTPQLKKELEYAISLKKPIIVIYDSKIGKTIHFKNVLNVNEVFVDFNNTDTALHNIAEFMRKYSKTKEKENENTSLGIGLITVGLGLLTLWALTKE